MGGKDTEKYTYDENNFQRLFLKNQMLPEYGHMAVPGAFTGLSVWPALLCRR